MSIRFYNTLSSQVQEFVPVEKGKVRFQGKALALTAGDVPDGPATLFLRPHDVDVLDNDAGALTGKVAVLRRHAGLRRTGGGAGPGGA